MNAREELLEFISTLSIIDTHEHIPVESHRLSESDVLSEWLTHYFSCDLRSAGLSEKALWEARGAGKDLLKRWKLVEPYWHAAESTGYGRSLAIAARDLYGIERIEAGTIGTLNERFREARAKGGGYDRVLKEKSRIAVCIRDPYDKGDKDCPDPFVFALRTDGFVTPGHYAQVRATGEAVGVRVHGLEDWKTVTRLHIEKAFGGKGRVVCLKSGLAYQRRLRYDKATAADAERDFHELFTDRNLPDWRPGIKIGDAFQNHMQHHVCKIADEMGLAYQFHTGIQEGNGNVVYDSNPALMTNLFLEYGNVKFDIFHMGYPYTMELSNLAKNFPNVHIDMCWGHIVSPEAARRALVEWLDAVPANKICAFGGDYCFVDGIYGHQRIARQNVAAALAQKVEDGSFGMDRAKEIASWLFFENPKRIFNLERHLPKEGGKARARRG